MPQQEVKNSLVLKCPWQQSKGMALVLRYRVASELLFRNLEKGAVLRGSELLGTRISLNSCRRGVAFQGRGKVTWEFQPLP
jgi:hypothetical protein